MRSLKDLRVGETARVGKVQADPAVKQRLLEMGFVKGEEVRLDRTAPMGDPMALVIKGYQLSLRREECACILLETEGA